MEVTSESSFERNDSFVIKQIDDSDATKQPVNIVIHSDDVISNVTENKDIKDALKVDNNGSVAGLMNRKNKPPNLNISTRLGAKLHEKILEIPDVKAALVKDEGYEMLRRRSHEAVTAKPIADRQPTPACDLDAEHFSFDPQPDIDSESITESDTSSVQSSLDINVEGTAMNRPHVEVLKDAKRTTNPLERIADSTGPSNVFGSPFKKDSGSIPSPLLKKKRRQKAHSTDEEDDSAKATTPKSRALLSRLKFASLGRSGSNTSLEGWDSLARALARVGASSGSLTALDSADLHPKLSPILKRHSQAERWSSASSSSSQVLS